MDIVACRLSDFCLVLLFTRCGFVFAEGLIYWSAWEVPTRTIDDFCDELAVYSLCYTLAAPFSRSLIVSNKEKFYGRIQFLFRET